MTQDKTDTPEPGSIEEQIEENKPEADTLENLKEDFKESDKGAVGSSKAGIKPVNKPGKKAVPNKKIPDIPSGRPSKESIQAKGTGKKSPSTAEKAKATKATKPKPKKQKKKPEKKKKADTTKAKKKIEIIDGHTYRDGLESCSACGLVQGNTTSECFGQQLFPATLLKFNAGDIDYKDGRWRPVEKKEE